MKKKIKYCIPSIRRSAPGPDLFCLDGSVAAGGDLTCVIGGTQADGCSAGNGEAGDCGVGTGAGNECITGTTATTKYAADGCSAGWGNVSCGPGVNHFTEL
jgi:hypothetical protein